MKTKHQPYDIIADIHGYADELRALLEILGYVERGGYFSFSTYFLHGRKSAQREAFLRIPSERILIETDSPDLYPTEEKNPHPLQERENRPLKHPANIALACEALAELREWSRDVAVGILNWNFHRLFRAS